MNYIFINIGDTPDYLKYSLNSVLSVDKEAKIIIATDKKTDFKNVIPVNLNDIRSSLTSQLIENEIYKNTNLDNNKLWLRSLLRIFYLYDVIDSLGINSAVHFDSDVLVYKPFIELKDNFIDNKLNITPLNSNLLVFGYSYINNKEVLFKINNHLLNEVKLTKSNEMHLMSIVSKQNPNLFNELRIFPNPDSKLIFDPASYGQYISGIHKKPYRFYKKRFITEAHPIGEKIKNKELKVKFKNSPFVISDKKVYEIANLHIHSKELKKFLPENYKEIV